MGRMMPMNKPPTGLSLSLRCFLPRLPCRRQRTVDLEIWLIQLALLPTVKRSALVQPGPADFTVHGTLLEINLARLNAHLQPIL